MAKTIRCRHCLKPIVWKVFAHRPRWVHVSNGLEHCGMKAAQPME